MGNAGKWGLQFRGAVSVRAMVEDLKSDRGLGSSGGPELVIVAGHSSGAHAAMHYVDLIKEWIGNSRVRVVGFFDSELPSNPCNGQSGSTCSSLLHKKGSVYEDNFVTPWAAIYSQFGATLNSTGCATDHASAPWVCMFGEYFLKYVQAPYFQALSKFDRFLLRTTLSSSLTVTANVASPADAEEDALALGRFVEQSANSIFSNRTRSQGITLFLPSCYEHAASSKVDFFTQAAEGVTLRDAFDTWLFPRGSWEKGPAVVTGLPFRSYEDSCSSFSCGAGCTSDCGGACDAPNSDTRRHPRSRKAVLFQGPLESAPE